MKHMQLNHKDVCLAREGVPVLKQILLSLSMVLIMYNHKLTL